jgi:acyl dehydratase
MTIVIARPEDLQTLVGQRLGYSDWLEITQERVDQFAAATGDCQWIHVDPARAASGPFHRTIAHGHLIVSLSSYLLGQIMKLRAFASVVNYGSDRVRFLSPVPVGARLRAEATLQSVTNCRGGKRLSMTMVFRVEGQASPACVARLILCAYL